MTSDAPAARAFRQVQFRQHAAHAAAADALDGGNRRPGSRSAWDSRVRRCAGSRLRPRRRRQRDDRAARRRQFQHIAGELLHLPQRYVDDVVTGRPQLVEYGLAVPRVRDGLAA